MIMPTRIIRIIRRIKPTATIAQINAIPTAAHIRAADKTARSNIIAAEMSAIIFGALLILFQKIFSN